MAQTWDKIIRQVFLQGNLMGISSGAALETAYTNPVIGQAELINRASQYSEDAVQDVILEACNRIIQLISLDRQSPYRVHFQAVTSNLANGALIPKVSSTAVPIEGYIGDVRDSVTGTRMESKTYDQVVTVLDITTLKQVPFWYFTNNVRIWHTVANVICDVIAWSQDEQRTLMNQAITRGACPFPESLHEAIVSGALAMLSRDGFNADQVQMWKGMFNETIQRLGANLSQQDVELRKIQD